MITTICALGPATILGYVIYTASTTNQINNEWIANVLLTVSGPYIATLCLLWVYFHFKFFAPMIKEVTINVYYRTWLQGTWPSYRAVSWGGLWLRSNVFRYFYWETYLL